MEVYVHLLSDVWPVQLCVDLAPLTPCTTSYLEDSSSYCLAEVLIVETLKLCLTPSGLVVTVLDVTVGPGRNDRRSGDKGLSTKSLAYRRVESYD